MRPKESPFSPSSNGPNRNVSVAPAEWSFDEALKRHDVRSIGIQRNDDDIRGEIEEQLQRREETSLEPIVVEVENGNVVLSGDVFEEDAQRVAEECARSVKGVREVVNRLSPTTGEDG